MIPIIRFLVLFSLLFVGAILLAHKLKIKQMRKWKNLTLNIIVTMAIINISSLPFENLILKYHSTNQAFYFLGGGDCLGVEEGATSSLLIANKGSKESYIYLEKGEKYLTAPFFKPKEKVVLGDRENGTVFTLINEKNTKNYYIIIFTTKAIAYNTGNIFISDSNSSTFQRCLYPLNAKNESFYLYSTYVKNMDSDYYININGVNYSIN